MHRHSALDTRTKSTWRRATRWVSCAVTIARVPRPTAAGPPPFDHVGRTPPFPRPRGARLGSFSSTYDAEAPQVRRGPGAKGENGRRGIAVARRGGGATGRGVAGARPRRAGRPPVRGVRARAVLRGALRLLRLQHLHARGAGLLRIAVDLARGAAAGARPGGARARVATGGGHRVRRRRHAVAA